MKLLRRNQNRNDFNQGGEWIENAFQLPDLFDDFITRDFFTPSFSNTGVSTPAVNIIETNEDFRIEMVAPGMKKKDFNIALQDNVLTISYDHEDNREGERHNCQYNTHEYNYHSFARSFSLPDSIETEKIKAMYEDGILTLTIPKKEEARTKPAKQIMVK
jgi:HSP20 family protein